MTRVRAELVLDPTGRPAKSTAALTRELKRETIRLSQVQDIAGCRIVVTDRSEQERVVASLKQLFNAAAVDDRRVTPSHGYRAVHVIPKIMDKPVEIQVRTLLQHQWAETSELLSDLIDPELKYGGGDPSTRDTLRQTADLVRELEETEGSPLLTAIAGLSGRDIQQIKQEYTDATDEFLRDVAELRKLKT